ncbi:putative carboxylesterase [Synechococcus sp. MIT S9220]|uniref:alpha/beta hydrolase n=1 Tax=unclassified Synechococcus TaxID=2626047 RepID=UPI001862F11C|nr:alpha/beta fold hydrolase [Synechococcus sp. MIT S9220]QNJ22155.1 putative carboxylesterase [Synechococcus sp. MIT S9220]
MGSPESWQCTGAAELIAASPEPFSMQGGPITVVLLHGYTGAPAELFLLAEALHAQGFGVEAPLLVGHGTCLEDLMPVQPHQWLEQVDGVVDRLLDQGQRVVVAGLSLGSILAIQAGMRRPRVEAVIAYSPPIVSGDPRALIAPLLSLLLPSVPRPADDFVDPATAERLWKYPRWPSRCSVRVLGLIAATRRQLGNLHQPLLVMASTLDNVITRRGVELLQQRARSERVEVHWLEGSGHVITADAEWKTVADQTLIFLKDL